MKTVLNSNGKRYEITQNPTDPTQATVILDNNDPRAVTTSLDTILESTDEVRDVQTVHLLSAQDGRPISGSYVFTGVIALHYSDPALEDKIRNYDYITRLSASELARSRIADRFAEKTGICRDDIFVSESMTLLRDFCKDDNIFEDFRLQAAAYFVGDTPQSLADKYGEQVYPAMQYTEPLYALILSARLAVGPEVCLDDVREFIGRALKKLFPSCAYLYHENPDDFIKDYLCDCVLFKGTDLYGMGFEGYRVLKRTEVSRVYNRSVRGNRIEEFLADRGSFEMDLIDEVEAYEGDDIDEYLL